MLVSTELSAAVTGALLLLLLLLCKLSAPFSRRTFTKSPTRQLRRVQLGSMVTNLPIFTLAEMPAGDVLLAAGAARCHGTSRLLQLPGTILHLSSTATAAMRVA
jgi:Flp pilus assembly protein protease CpaA